MAGLVVRVLLVFVTEGQRFDIRSYEVVGNLLRSEGLGVYRGLIERLDDLGEPIVRWPYPPLLFPWILGARFITRTGLDLSDVIKLPMVAADFVIAGSVLALTTWRREPEQHRLAAVALVLLGPSFFLISAYHGQFDAIAIAPAVLALVAWERCSESSRPWVTGGLIGLGAGLKTVPLFVLLAFLPAAKGRAERVRLTVAAVAVPALALLPFLVATPRDALRAMTYGGAPGAGGWSLLIQPGLAEGFLLGRRVEFSSASLLAWNLAPYVIATAVLAVGITLLRRKPFPAEGAVLVWLAVYAASPNFFHQYLVWGLPFFIVAGALRSSAAVQVMMVFPILAVLNRPLGSEALAGAYRAIMVIVWVGFVVVLAHQWWRIERQPVTRGHASRDP